MNRQFLQCTYTQKDLPLSRLPSGNACTFHALIGLLLTTSAIWFRNVWYQISFSLIPFRKRRTGYTKKYSKKEFKKNTFTTCQVVHGVECMPLCGFGGKCNKCMNVIFFLIFSFFTLFFILFDTIRCTMENYRTTWRRVVYIWKTNLMLQCFELCSLTTHMATSGMPLDALKVRALPFDNLSSGESFCMYIHTHTTDLLSFGEH